MKAVFRNSAGLKLAGILSIPRKKCKSIIIMAHGFIGDKDEGGRFVKAAEKFCSAGFAVLRFDFGGYGESEKTAISIEKQAGDLKSAISFARKKGFINIGLLGFSLGGLCSVLAYDEQIKAMVLWAPVTSAMVPRRLKGDKIKVELNKRGYAIVENDDKKFRVDKNMLAELLATDQKEILSHIRCPVLIIHGDKDDRVPIEQSRNAMKHLKGKLEIIENEGHEFYEKLDEVILLSLEWFKKHL